MSLVTTNDVLRPGSLDEYLGQNEVKSRLRPWIAEAKATGDPLAHVLLTSEPGMGKTTLAQAIATELGDPIHPIDLSRMTDKQFASFVRRFEGGILFIDEIHRAAPKQQENLLTLMEEHYVPTALGGRVELEFFTVIAATTERHKLLPAVASRFDLHLELADYSDDEMAQIIAGMAEKLGVGIPNEDCQRLGLAAGGNPRAARDIVKAWRALTYEGNASVESVLKMTDREPDGLTHMHLEYLRVLESLEGSAGERALCNHLRVHPSELASLERLLVRRRMVALPSTGRAITGIGDARLRGRNRTTRRHRMELNA